MDGAPARLPEYRGFNTKISLNPGVTNPMTLRATCVQNICTLLKFGVWKRCAENPFRCMPTSVIQELLSHLVSESPERSIAHFRLLIKSGRLENVVLPPGGAVNEYVSLLRMLAPGCRNMRTLSVRHYLTLTYERGIAVERALRKVLRRCTRLEHLHSCVLFDPADLRNCSNLENLRLHFGEKEVRRFFEYLFSYRWRGPSEKEPLRSVEVLSLCQHLESLGGHHEQMFVNPKIIMLLENCPRLASLGFFDSSVALKELHDRGLRTGGALRQFQLRRCFWGDGRNVRLHEYCDAIRVAALSCPLVEVLVMEVRHACVLRDLKILRKLTHLIVVLTSCDDDFDEELGSLLQEIGHQIQHLCVHIRVVREPLHINSICESCPNLRTLKVDGVRVAADEGLRLPNLERLSASSGPEGLFHMLSSCPRLKSLCVPESEWLEDGGWLRILRENPFTELEVLLLDYCYLSEKGLRSLLQSAPRLRLCCVDSDNLNSIVMSQCVGDLNNGVVCYLPERFRELEQEQFPYTYSNCCWL